MSFLVDLFAKSSVAGSLGTGWTTYSTSATSSAQWAIASQQAVTGANATGTNVGLATGVTPQTGSQFAELVQVGNVGASLGPMVNAEGTSVATLSGYSLRDTGSELALQKVSAGAGTTLAAFAYTRAAGQKIRIESEQGTGQVTLRGYLNGTLVVTVVDSTSPYTAGRPGMRSATTPNVAVDDFRGGDLTDLAAAQAATASTTNAGGTVAGDAPVETINVPPADGIPTWRGLRFDRAGTMIMEGERLHRLQADFIGPAGAYTPPAWLTIPAGTATLQSPTTTRGTLDLTTGATSGDKARMEVAFGFSAVEHAAIRVDLGLAGLTAASPAADMRLIVGDGVSVGGGATHLNGTDRLFLHSGGEHLRTRVESAWLGADAARRKAISLLVLPRTRELFLFERDKIIGYRDGLNAWNTGTLTVAVEITARAAAAVTLRLTSFTVDTFA